jgi:hypothetical protein
MKCPIHVNPNSLSSQHTEWSQTLLTGSWTTVTDTGNAGASPPQHTFSVPIGSNPKLYMRLKVTNPNP